MIVAPFSCVDICGERLLNSSSKSKPMGIINNSKSTRNFGISYINIIINIIIYLISLIIKKLFCILKVILIL